MLEIQVNNVSFSKGVYIKCQIKNKITIAIEQFYFIISVRYVNNFWLHQFLEKSITMNKYIKTLKKITNYSKRNTK